MKYPVKVFNRINDLFFEYGAGAISVSRQKGFMFLSPLRTAQINLYICLMTSGAGITQA